MCRIVSGCTLNRLFSPPPLPVSRRQRGTENESSRRKQDHRRKSGLFERIVLVHASSDSRSTLNATFVFAMCLIANETPGAFPP